MRALGSRSTEEPALQVHVAGFDRGRGGCARRAWSRTSESVSADDPATSMMAAAASPARRHRRGARWSASPGGGGARLGQRSCGGSMARAGPGRPAGRHARSREILGAGGARNRMPLERFPFRRREGRPRRTDRSARVPRHNSSVKRLPQKPAGPEQLVLESFATPISTAISPCRGSSTSWSTKTARAPGGSAAIAWSRSSPAPASRVTGPFERGRVIRRHHPPAPSPGRAAVGRARR